MVSYFLHFILLKPEYFPTHFFIKHLYFMFFPQINRPLSTLIKMQGNIVRTTLSSAFWKVDGMIRVFDLNDNNHFLNVFLS